MRHSGPGGAFAPTTTTKEPGWSSRETVLEAPTLGVRFEFRRTAAETGGEYTRDGRDRPAARVHRPAARAPRAGRAPRGHRGRDGDPPARAHARARSRRVRRDAGRHRRTGTWPRARGPGRVRLTATPGRPDGGVRGAARGDGPGGRVHPPRPPEARARRAPRARLRRRRARRLAAARASSARSPTRSSRRRSSPPTSTCSSTSGTSTRRSRPSTPRSATPRPTPSGGGRPTSASAPRATRASGRSTTTTSAARCPTRSRPPRTTTRYEPPTLVETAVDGDLRGTGTWTLTPARDGGTHVRFDWRVVRRPPVPARPHARPAAASSAGTTPGRSRAPRPGLEPYARRRAAERRRDREPAVNAP